MLLQRLQTCIWPGPPGLYQSDPETFFCQQSNGEVFDDVIIEDGQTAVVRQTSVDCCEPVDLLLSVNLVTCRVVYNTVLTARLCTDIKYKKCLFTILKRNEERSAENRHNPFDSCQKDNKRFERR